MEKRGLTWPLNQESLDRIRESVKLLDACRLPAANPQVFPNANTHAGPECTPIRPTVPLYSMARRCDVNKRHHANSAAWANLTRKESVELDDLMRLCDCAREFGNTTEALVVMYCVYQV